MSRSDRFVWQESDIEFEGEPEQSAEKEDEPVESVDKGMRMEDEIGHTQ